MLKIGIYQVKIEVEDRGEFGKYGIVYSRCPLDPDPHEQRFKKIGILAPGMKLSEKMFYDFLMWSSKGM